ncbi:UNVERIFIED_CONTAM: putative mitochondrial protein [Sesamum radiatum]|uniref:Mitochondrial protein n=1 Tax=Sesamum radiatum TaxID=300843 RepID=A0AAW2KAB7_SESRA
MMKSELEELLAREELLWKQRSKAEWLREGDKNTAYFHARANERRKRNMISSLQSEEGCFTSDRENIQDIILRHFKTVYSSTNPDLSVMEAILILSILEPISLCNVIYKLASKTIANRIKPFLNGIISSSQSAFIPGRLITDNVLVAYELNHYLAHKRWGSMGHVALKLDISKAYDRVEWVFLERALLKLGFHSEFAKLIMSCVNSVSYSIMLESEPFGFIRPERGLRQGDPLSPYLFLFCAEAFSCMIQKEEREGNIQRVAVCRKAPRVSHLLFADDTLLYCQATIEAMDCIKGILTKFESASGLKINLQKSAVVFSKNMDQALKQALASQLGVVQVDKHEKYLGLPTVAGRSKRELFVSLKNRIWSKMQNWGAKRLSKPVGWCLLKRWHKLFRHMPWDAFYYLMGYFMTLKVCLQNSSGSNERQSIHWLSWKKLCKDKNNGGVGFRTLKAFNLALLAKQAWRLITYPDSLLSQIMKAKYYPESDFFRAKCGGQPSYTWRSILASRDLIRQGARWKVGDGKLINIVSDPWLPRPLSFKLIMRPKTLQETSNVSELLIEEGRRWNEELLEKEFGEEDVQSIKSIEIPSPVSTDVLVWHFGNKGNFSVKSAYELYIQQIDEASTSVSFGQGKNLPGGWRFLWQAKVPPKVKLLAWRACKDALPVCYNLRRRGLLIATNCIRCGDDTEDVLHVLLRCSFSRQVWALSSLPWRWIKSEGSSTEEWMRGVWQELNGSDFSLFLLICWCLWWSRNQLAFEAISLAPMDIIISARRVLLSFQRDPMVQTPPGVMGSS